MAKTKRSQPSLSDLLSDFMTGKSLEHFEDELDGFLYQVSQAGHRISAWPEQDWYLAFRRIGVDDFESLLCTVASWTAGEGD